DPLQLAILHDAPVAAQKIPTMAFGVHRGGLQCTVTIPRTNQGQRGLARRFGVPHKPGDGCAYYLVDSLQSQKLSQRIVALREVAGTIYPLQLLLLGQCSINWFLELQAPERIRVQLNESVIPLLTFLERVFLPFPVQLRGCPRDEHRQHQLYESTIVV